MSTHNNELQARPVREPRPLDENKAAIFRCPACRAPLREKAAGELSCVACAQRYPTRDGVVDLAPSQDYVYSLQSLSHERLRRLITETRDCGFDAAYWKYVLEDFASRSQRVRSRGRRLLRDLYLSLNGRTIQSNVRTVFFESPAYLWLLTALPPDGCVLDLGAGCSAISHVIARDCDRIVAADATLERLQLSALRAADSGTRNMTFARVPTTDVLPFEDATFDLVLLNGVLEWMPTTIDGDPIEVQRRMLAEARRVLKADGQILVAIENRYAFADLLGFPEGHMGLPWIGVIPRVFGRLYHRIAKKQPLRVTTHSRRKLERLLCSAGFSHKSIETFAPLPTYAWFDTLGSLNETAAQLLPRATIADHATLRRRAAKRVFQWGLRPFANCVPAFAAVGGNKRHGSVVRQLVHRVGKELGASLALPIRRLDVRESKVLLEVACEDTNDIIHISMGMSQPGDARVRNESRALQWLADGAVDLAEAVPRVLWSGCFRGHTVVAVSHVPGKPLVPSPQEHDSWRKCADALSLLEDAARIVPCNRDVGELWHARWAAVDPMWATPARSRMARHLQSTLQPRGPQAGVPAVFGHGDLHPGNIIMSGEKKIGIIDWESSGPAHPLEDRVACSLGHIRAAYGGIGRSILAALDASDHQVNQVFASFVPGWEAKRETHLRLIAFVWLKRLENAMGVAVTRDPSWLEMRAWRVLERFTSMLPPPK